MVEKLFKKMLVTLAVERKQVKLAGSVEQPNIFKLQIKSVNLKDIR